ncbi:MAG: 50S ribosomal protein L18Ae [archaeon]|jgi:ribosomal protein L20A (L18A)
MKTYETKGTYKKKGEIHKFDTKVTAENEKMATEKVFAEMGSKQRLTRVNIKLESIKEAKQ